MRRFAFVLTAAVTALSVDVWGVTAAAPDGGVGRGELAGHGTDADRHDLPAAAIDTRQVPRIRPHPDADGEPLPHYRLGPDTYFLYGNIETVSEENRGFNGNAGFVVTDEGVVVIDSLGTPELGRRLIATVRSVTDRPIRYLVLTHHHPDHAYGTSAFLALDDVEIVSHPGLRDYIHSEQRESSVGYRRDFIPDAMDGFALVEADVYAPGKRFEKVRLEIGDAAFDVYNVGRHHSSGDLVVHQLEDGIVWISDLAFNQRVTYMGDGDSRQILEGQKWLMDHLDDVRLMVPGHGSAQTEPFPMVAETRSYVKGLRDRVSQMVRDDRSLQEAIEEIEMAEWKDVRLYGENHRSNVDFVYRELELELF